ncbi:hypothetical protein QYE76_048878 [Lolium multiflorum]|uniref:Legume lectin domain-containing protein n=1 Tax=Lolium multiflorum TaxID=4521 RepID=A0AAD8SN75_LOLMU|nr:hypothetical protein QYE76_048878 [Lolium multiflorum]
MLMVTPTSRLLLFHLYASCCFFLLTYHVLEGAAASPFSFSFDFSDRSKYLLEDLRFEGDAAQHDGAVDLTCNSMSKPRFNCKGRMSYNHPVPFYQTTTDEVASFSTRFNFAIGFPGQVAGDGMAFFLSSYPSMLPLNSGGGNLGLHNGDGITAKTTDRIVAVEFDTFKNDFDNSFDHIGIDINTARASVNTTSVNGSINGSMTAIITFNSSTLMLVATLHFDNEPSRPSYQWGQKPGGLRPAALPLQLAAVDHHLVAMAGGAWWAGAGAGDQLACVVQLLAAMACSMSDTEPVSQKVLPRACALQNGSASVRVCAPTP